MRSETLTPSLTRGGPPTTTQRIFAAARQLNWQHFEGAAALRPTIGVAIVLAAGFFMGDPSISAFGAIGAVSVGFGSFQGAYRSRAALMLWAGLGMALSIFIGAVAGHWTVAFIISTVVATFACGMLVALGPSASFVGLQCVVAVLIAGAFPSEPRLAALGAATVFAGGLVQTILVAIVWPLRLFPAERKAMAAAYRSLADYALKIPNHDFVAPEPHTLASTSSPMTDPQPFARVGEVLVFQALLDEAERIRASLAAITTQRPRMITPHGACANELAMHAAHALEEIAVSLAQGREPRESILIWEPFDRCARELSYIPAVAALIGQVRSAWHTASVMTPPDHREVSARFRPLRRRPAVRDAFTTLRANLTRESSAFRHAVRLTVTIGLCTVLYRVLSIDRGYWIALTALLVLRPEFQDTFARGVSRIAGTIAGALLATAIVSVWTPNPLALMMLVLMFVWGCFALVRINYALFTASVTGYVIFILMLSGVGEMTAASMRTLYTITGGAIALAAYAVWPTWSASGVRIALGKLFDAQSRYVGALMSAYTRSSAVDLGELSEMRSDARLARSNAEAIVERMLDEPPGRASMAPPIALGLLSALRRNALAALALHAGVERGIGPPLVGIGKLADEVTAALALLGAAVRGDASPSQLPPLRETQRRLDDKAQLLVGEETSLMVDSIDTMAGLLSTHHGV
ncbi:MAG TPA: FUSC family protein [Vicinamibacterales bacterium]|nr:FUSC family protein [Vicinamibacterales bacterium]